MSLTKKHFIAIARIIAKHYEDLENSPFLQDNSLPDRLADYFTIENANFDRARFLKACGVEE